MALGIILEKATPYRLRYQVNAAAQTAGVNAIQAVTLLNKGGTTPDIGTDAIAGSPLAVEMAKNLSASDLDLSSYLQGHPNVDVSLLVRKAYAGNVGTDYLSWAVDMVPSNAGLVQFNIVGPSAGGVAALQIAYCHSIVD